jgi:hypothetical protein
LSRALHRRAKAVRRVNDLGRRRSLDADTAIRMWGSALTLVNRPSSTVATTPRKCTWHSTYGSCWMVMEVTIVVLFYETVTHHGNPSASEPQPKDPPLTSPPSETVSQSRKMHNCHSEQSEESNVSCHLLKRDPSAIASGMTLRHSLSRGREERGHAIGVNSVSSKLSSKKLTKRLVYFSFLLTQVDIGHEQLVLLENLAVA